MDTGATSGPGSPQDLNAWFNVLPSVMADRPLSNYFVNATLPYYASMPYPGGVGPIWHCPAARADGGDSFRRGGRFGFFSYTMNIDLKLVSSINNGVVGNSFPYPNMPKLGGIRKPTDTVMLVDSAFSPTLENYIYGPDRNGIFPASRWQRFTKRHGNLGGNINFVDGHAAFFDWEYIFNESPAGDSRVEKFNPDVIWNPNRDKQ